MRYKFEDIEGIGRAYGSKLSKAGFNATDDLLKQCGSAKGRRQVAAASGLDEGQLLNGPTWPISCASAGIGKQFSELLEAAGVDTVKELRTRRADNLATKMKEANAAKKPTRATPTERQVAGWIDQAKSMAPMISH